MIKKFYTCEPVIIDLTVGVGSNAENLNRRCPYCRQTNTFYLKFMPRQMGCHQCKWTLTIKDRKPICGIDGAEGTRAIYQYETESTDASCNLTQLLNDAAQQDALEKAHDKTKVL